MRPFTHLLQATLRTNTIRLTVKIPLQRSRYLITACRSQFHHEPLTRPRSFRLMALQPGRSADPLSCHIFNADMTDPPPYEGVSYVWGSEVDKATILCNGAALPITRNLEKALKRFRNPDSERVLWVDSVCIDQGKTAEKNHQVQFMGQIYSNAVRVLIWLCDEDEGIDLAAAIRLMTTVSNINRDNEIFPQPFHRLWLNHERPLDYETVRTSLGLPLPDSDEVIAVKAFWDLAYWFRAWVFQESWLAKESRVHFGQVHCSVKLLSRVYLNLLKLDSTTRDHAFLSLRSTIVTPMLTGSFHERVSRRDRKLTSLTRLLLMRRGAQCKDPRDLIYSILGCTTDELHITPDYDKPFERVFAEVVGEMIRLQQNLDILGFMKVARGMPAPGDPEPMELPSWVPDWRGPEHGAPTRPRVFGDIERDRFSCTGATKPRYSISDDAQELSVYGYEIDEICELNMPHDGIEDMSEGYFDAPVDFEPPFDPETYTGVDDEEVAEMRTLCAGRSIPDEAYPAGRWTEATTAIYVSIMEDWLVRRQGRERYRALVTKIYHVTNLRKWMGTREGWAGLAPFEAQIGDKVVLLLGGRVPFLLRPRGTKYILIGECYVDGIMDGEAYKPLESTPPREFVLV